MLLIVDGYLIKKFIRNINEFMMLIMVSVIFWKYNAYIYIIKKWDWLYMIWGLIWVYSLI